MTLRRQALAVVSAGAMLVCPAQGAATTDYGVRTHVRGATVDAALLLDKALTRSATVRDLVGRLEHSDLLVYIRYERFSSASLRGRIGFLAADENQRRFAIEIDVRYSGLDQISILGHELRHAVEIASAPAIRDARSLAAYYASIGELTGYNSYGETYETAAAAAAGRQVLSELHGAPPPVDSVYPPPDR